MTKTKHLVVLCSGVGSTLQAMIDQLHNQNTSIRINAVICDKNCQAMTRGITANIPSFFLPKRPSMSKKDYDNQLSQCIDTFQPDFIILSGFMRILSEDFVNKYPKKIINIHPSLLPKFKGLHTHQRVIMANEKKHGTTVHYVDQTLDGGEIIAQRCVDINPSDTAETLQMKIKQIEYQFYPEIIQKLCKAI
ncbi:phosphoribosylglycinamide formyltransferase [Facilibium subflavum]|uniref:phosphoribosylglycinamide formyltransferase n=1 Tax=Facilibium subflavum TaxID=2219058 RepID=UPI0013C36754|nr:phosphoribosylglycinamide formyltransferase [Facilibium subflavum]